MANTPEANPETEVQGPQGGLTLLPPAKDVCQACATKHEPEFPHNQGSLYWQYWFYGKHGRWPKLKDSMAHCTPQMRKTWLQLREQVLAELAETKKGRKK